MLKKRLGGFVLLAIIGVAGGLRGASPNTIRFQGRLTDNGGNPIVGPNVRVKFALYNTLEGGASVWGMGESVVATNEAGLFSTDIGPLDPALLTSNPDLFLQVSVHDGASFKDLKPRQKLSSVPYALHADFSENSARSAATDSIPDNIVSTATLQAAVLGSLIPSGMIAMFDASCPAGWTGFTQMDNRFPLGVPSFTGNGGGNPTITGLQISPAGQHSHTLAPHSHSVSMVTQSASSACGEMGGGGSGCHPSDWTHTHNVSGTTANNSGGLTTSNQPDHTHGITQSQAWLPPYMGVVFCKKN